MTFGAGFVFFIYLNVYLNVLFTTSPFVTTPMFLMKRRPTKFLLLATNREVNLKTLLSHRSQWHVISATGMSK